MATYSRNTEQAVLGVERRRFRQRNFRHANPVKRAPLAIKGFAENVTAIAEGGLLSLAYQPAHRESGDGNDCHQVASRSNFTQRLICRQPMPSMAQNGRR